MTAFTKFLTPSVAALVVFVVFLLQPLAASSQTAAQKEELDSLFEQLQTPVDGDWQSIEKQIWEIWSLSGSAAMDLLLKRGRDAIKAGEYKKAVEHLSALTEQAPNFAEGWNARATAWFMLGKYSLAVSDIEKTLALNPRHFGAMVGLALIFEEVNQPKNALKAYQAALAVHPFRPDILEAIKRLTKETKGESL